jgi:hypothetical protein
VCCHATGANWPSSPVVVPVLQSRDVGGVWQYDPDVEEDNLAGFAEQPRGCAPAGQQPSTAGWGSKVAHPGAATAQRPVSGGPEAPPPQRTVHSSMYASLRTNLPREIMGFLDLPFTPAAMGAVADGARHPLQCSREQPAHMAGQPAALAGSEAQTRGGTGTGFVGDGGAALREQAAGDRDRGRERESCRSVDPRRFCCHQEVRCTALDCASPRCAGLRCTALRCAALDCAALDCAALHCTGLHCTVIHRTVYLSQ